MQKLFHVVLLALLIPGLGFAQTKDRDVIASAGDHSATASLEISWTVGEVAVANRTGANLQVSEGFQQGFQPATAIDEEATLDGSIMVFPNPVTDVLHFEVKSETNWELQGTLYDLTGRRVLDIPTFRVQNEYRGQIDVSNLPAGKWILRFSGTGSGAVKTFTVTKLR